MPLVKHDTDAHVGRITLNGRSQEVGVLASL
jgi:hypothetical protein